LIYCAVATIVREVSNSNGTLKHNPFADLAKTVTPSAARARPPSPEGAAGVNSRDSAESPRKTAVFAEKVVLRQETKGRHGKTVTRVTGVASGDLAELASQLKKALGCGATVEDGDLLLLGAVEERAASWFRNAGAPRIVSSGRTTVQVAIRESKSNAFPPPQRATLDKSASSETGGKQRTELRPGLRVAIVLKADQPTGKLTEGIIESILTRSSSHPHGIKVRLASGQVGRVKRILSD